MSDALSSSISETLLSHDDVPAVQRTIDAALAGGGGTVQFGAATYNLFRPQFHAPDGTWSTNIYDYYWWDSPSLLHIADKARGNINIEGAGTNTIINTPPDHAGSTALLVFGHVNLPPQLPGVEISETAKGSTTVTVSQQADMSMLNPGTDVEIYSGSFSTSPDTCEVNTGEGGSCHYSELNTVAAVNGNVITLAYPTSKRYYNDGSDNFGLVVHTVPHIIAIQNLLVNTYNYITQVGSDVDGLLINGLVIPSFVSHGPFPGGVKRNVTIENSVWGIGAGDESWNGTNELDKCDNMVFQNNQITGYSAPGAEGPSLGARVYATEGTSQLLYQDNTLSGVSLYFQDTTDDAILNNEFSNGVINMGSEYGDITPAYNWGLYHAASFDSFASQQNALVSHNKFMLDTSFVPPAVITLGHFESASIVNNTIDYAGSRNIPVVVSYGGTITDNTIIVSGSAQSTGIGAVADESPTTAASPFTIQDNSISAQSMYAGIYVPDPGFDPIVPFCIDQNTVSMHTGQSLVIALPGPINLTCSMLTAGSLSAVYPVDLGEAILRPHD